jgi:hypothetical protein
VVAVTRAGRKLEREVGRGRRGVGAAAGVEMKGEREEGREEEGRVLSRRYRLRRGSRSDPKHGIALDLRYPAGTGTARDWRQ